MDQMMPEPKLHNELINYQNNILPLAEVEEEE